MNTGAAFYIGKQHKICQDYASHNIVSQPYILVSDGCSSSPCTDFGSRILNRVAGDMLVLDKELNSIKLMDKADEIRRFLNLPQESLDATLLSLYVKDNRYYLNIFGDGVVAKIKEDKSIEIIIIEYLSGAPNYLSYNSNVFRKKSYLDLYGLKRKICTYTLQPSGIVENISIKEDLEDASYFEENFYDTYESISLMSDGVLSFYELLTNSTYKIQNAIPINDVLLKLLDFKSFQGEFVDRRLQKFRKDCEKNNWFHADDITLATIFFGDKK